MAVKAAKAVVPAGGRTAKVPKTLGEPRVNERYEDLNRGKEIVLDDDDHNPSPNSIHVTGFRRSEDEYTEIGLSFLNNRK